MTAPVVHLGVPQLGTRCADRTVPLAERMSLRPDEVTCTACLRRLAAMILLGMKPW